MRKVVMYCDRCGKEFEKWNDKRKEFIGIGEYIHGDGDPYLDYQKDLCESCYDELEKWWNSETAIEEVDIAILRTRQEGADTKPVKKHKDVDFRIGDKVRTLVETVDGCKLFPVGTIGEITDIDDTQSLPYTVSSEELHDHWYYPKDALELVEEDE